MFNGMTTTTIYDDMIESWVVQILAGGVMFFSLFFLLGFVFF